jgi:prepilin-type N-terminal cleavage/methylation domain-containing protein
VVAFVLSVDIRSNHQVMKSSSNRRGFSLGEVLVAVAIIAVIAAVVIPSVSSQLKTGDESRIGQDLRSVRSAVTQFLSDVRRYPKTIGQLVRRPTAASATDGSLDGSVYTTAQVARWRGPYLSKDSTSILTSGFETSITNAFANNLSYQGQLYMTIGIASMDSVIARNMDLRFDDGVKTTGMMQWTVANPTAFTFYALPYQP